MSQKFVMSVHPSTYRHYLNGIPVVLHCHHYLTLYTRAAEQFSEIGGPGILAESMEDAVRPLLDNLFGKEPSASPQDRFQTGTELYSFMGLGSMKIEGNAEGGQVTLLASHLDQGWIKKWGKNDKPVNYVTGGYLAALFAAVFAENPRSFAVTEMEAVVTGAPQSVFIVKKIT
jgi:hypothetical protein